MSELLSEHVSEEKSQQVIGPSGIEATSAGSVSRVNRALDKFWVYRVGEIKCFSTASSVRSKLAQRLMCLCSFFTLPQNSLLWFVTSYDYFVKKKKTLK
jgi:hypothetical protein